MSEYDAYGELYDQRPSLLIHDRLKNSGTVQRLIELAKQQNFNVSFDRGPFRQDMIIKWHKNDNLKEQPHSVSSAMRYFSKFS